MNQTVPFHKMFPDIDISAFRDAEVLGVAVDKRRASMDVRIRANAPARAPELRELEATLCREFGVSRAAVLLEGAENTGDAAPPAKKIPAKPERGGSAPGGGYAESNKPGVKKPQTVILGRAPAGTVTEMSALILELGRVRVRGRVFAVKNREVKNGGFKLSFDITDGTGSIRVSRYFPENDITDSLHAKLKKIKEGTYLSVSGELMLDHYENHDLTLRPRNIALTDAPEPRSDGAEVKRVELHLHTKMSAMDALTDVEEVIKRAIAWGHPAIAITDHGVAHAFPDALNAAKGKIRVLYGVEGYFVNDVDAHPAVFGELNSLPDEIVVFDVETTGLSAFNDKITQIAAVTVRNGEIVSRFQTYTDPGIPIPAEITELTGITDETVRGAPDNLSAVRAFLEYAAGRPLAAHNAQFDLGMIYEICWQNGIEFSPVCFCTMELSRAFFPTLKNHKLPTMAEEFGISGLRHHHADSDAEVTGKIMWRFLEMLQEEGYKTTREINALAFGGIKRNNERKKHIIIFARTQAGVKNLYQLISKSHVDHFYYSPTITKSMLLEHREGLCVGSACEAGEIFGAVEKAAGSRFNQHRLGRLYDYFEIQPVFNNLFMLRGENPRARDEEQLRGYNRRVVALGEELGIPVAATGDVHFLDPEDEIFRNILLHTKKMDEPDKYLPIYFRTTDEMLREFEYLGAEKAYETVVTNTRKIAESFEDVRPLPPAKTLYPPKIEGSAEQLETFVRSRLLELYGDDPPELITARAETELRDIIGSGYDVVYIAARRLVADSLENGYLVGSRGSVGSSFVAYLSGATEVNPLPPHYLCPGCKRVDFASGESYGCGADMPDGDCPECGAKLNREGFNIPFETFLGLGGEKVADIDLNFSGEYQAKAHKYAIDMFGADKVYRAGTISTVKADTAYSYVMKYLEDYELTATKAEINRLAQGCTGVKRTTGQHPGGLVVIPADMDITDFCPVQRPADKDESDVITTHFEYHAMEDNLLKLDLLGHDDPTMLKMLTDMTGADARAVPLNDPEVLRIFRTPEALGIESDEIIGTTGATGLPEFGTDFTREMLVDTLPETVDTLVRLSGYSHGTDVWLNNAQDIIKQKIADISETIGCRDDIMLFLISKGMDGATAFKIMESVRKGKGLPGDTEARMRSLGVPEWYIESCKKIKYLFPKAHAVAYVMMALRIAWFKVHRPLEFYSAYFYRRSQNGAFDADMMTRGDAIVCERIREIRLLPKRDRKDKDDALLTTLESCHEFYKRGFKFLGVDLHESDPVKFTVCGDDSLRAPFISVAGLGDGAAHHIQARRKKRRFISVEDFSQVCSKISSAHIEQFRKLGVFKDLPETSQLSLF